MTDIVFQFYALLENKAEMQEEMAAMNLCWLLAGSPTSFIY